jgi:probable S-adenosylmethionine-dependent methyltransferase, YraL family
MEDITFRAIKTLESVDVVACEDTRHTGILLSHFNIKKRTISCHQHNEAESAKGILQLLDEGCNIAYCSDAGTPGISDPGARLCEYIRNNSDHQIVPIPGASAGISLMSVAGAVGKAFTFEGFLSPKSGRRKKRLEELLSRGEAFIIYESPFRVVKILKEIAELAPNAKVVCGRELTKTFEEITVKSAAETAKDYASRPSVKGEFAIIVAPGGDEDDNAEEN